MIAALAAGVFGLGLLTSSSLASSRTPAPAGAAYVTSEHLHRVISIRFDGCMGGGTILPAFQVITPPGLATVDATLTLTIAYSVTPQDHVNASASVDGAAMAPDSWPLWGTVETSKVFQDTRTVSWVATGLT